ncbi:TcdA/TcdB catalytic glycosyltransferase domain-containing protein [Pantoea sp. App145]|uniref:TcdA/TcdB catalytic glycosyltransferase domain-containing protein n=1 Tax=Pantoea sp. App145 TaxID=3071567 RepID=UPI003A7F6335
MLSVTNAISSASNLSLSNRCRVDSSFHAPQSIISINNTEITHPGSNVSDEVSEKMDCSIKVPEIVHFVWEGNGAPEAHLANILNFRRINPEFEIKIWTTCPGTINRTLEKMLNGDDAKYRYLAFNFSDKKDEIRFLITEDPRPLFSAFPQGVYAAWAREHGGSFANHAAASDVTRLVALYHYGGTYFDVDISMTRKFHCPVYDPLKKYTSGILTYGNPVITAIKNSPAILVALMKVDKNYKVSPRKTNDDFYSKCDLFKSDKHRFRNKDVWDIKRTTNRGRIYGSVALTGIDIYKEGWWPAASPSHCDDQFGHNDHKNSHPANVFGWEQYKNEKSYHYRISDGSSFFFAPLNDPLERDWRRGADGKAESYKWVSKLKSRRTSI